MHDPRGPLHRWLADLWTALVLLIERKRHLGWPWG